MGARRAYGGEDKEARRATILEAAGALFGEGDGALPTVVSIARAAGLAKGTVYLYFPSKEAIFSAVLLIGWGEVVGIVEEAFAPTEEAFAPTNAPAADDPVGAFLKAYVAFVDDHRTLLRLDALRPLLEQGLDLASLIDFKRTFVERLIAGGVAIEKRLGLGDGRGVKLLTRTHALTCGLWQSFGAERPIEAAVPDLPNTPYPDFLEELSEAMSEFWRGALLSSPNSA